MASSEEKQHLETLLADTFGTALDSVRRSLAGELQRHADSRARTARAETHRDLRDAVARLDTCRRQTEILGALLEESGRFGSRAALWITTGEEARGWASYGFEGGAAIESLAAGYDAEPWSLFARGTGCVELEGDAAVDFAAAMGPGRPDHAVLVPLVLRDRVAAVLYADRLAGDETYSVEALQLLTLAAALLLEVQGLRGRERTPTLHPASATGPALGLWEPETGAPARVEVPPARPVVAPEPEAEAPSVGLEPPAEAVEESAAAAEPIGEAAGEVEEVSEDDSLWAETEELPQADFESLAEADEQLEEAELEAAELDEFEVEELPEPEELEEARPADETTAPIPSQPVGAEPTVRISQEMIEEAQEEAAAPQGVEAVEAIEEVEAEEVEEPTDGSEDRTVLLDRSTIPEAAKPAPAPPKPVPPTGSTEVAPPPDLEGPGLAFRQAEEPIAVDVGDDETAAAHEEARRLARLLVSEIKLYNEEEVEAGRRTNDIYPRLQEDIDRSRQMYRDRVDPRVRDDVDYFQQELVNILAGGDPDALGL
jgi:hypothetical protein